ncbi:MAG: carbamoyltransferase HypF [Chloroflexi bacterium]|nr:MAG: carbamoyltransferase HypF [Chloroflexota bacterium]
MTITRHQLTVTGVVQGVGFRPFVYSLAMKFALNGFVGNNSSGVFIEIEGPAHKLAQFQTALRHKAPPLAHIETVTITEIPTTGDDTFIIVHSETQAAANTLISPDICICDDCLQEIFDPSNRRFGYPFTNCTNCGPRFTIIRDIPYDRPHTTMAAFPMCPDCQAEYDDPLNRRFHAQPNACKTCGPQIWLEPSQSFPIHNSQFPIHHSQFPIHNSQFPIHNSQFPIHNSQFTIPHSQTLLARGKILAVKGLGGFHLACDATNDTALNSLRERKGRVGKPFAVMALDVTAVRQFAYLSPAEETLLTSKERPILLLRKKENSPLSALVAPGNNYIGVMLPYTPLHYLLLSAPTSDNRKHQPPHTKPILIMTSANYANEPIVKDNDEARQRLSSLADAFLFHNRDIHIRADDSVVRVLDLQLTNNSPRPQPSIIHRPSLIPVRRSRGYAPFPVKLPFGIPTTLAVGGELKATFCLTKDNFAFMSQHIGDMENLETLAAFETAVSHFKAIFRAEPERIVCDMHPGYLSTQWAERQKLPLTKVQHHHAHIAAVMAEHQHTGRHPVIGFSFDGTGYGTDGAIWGGEVMLADYQHYERVSHLKYVPLVGGDTAVKRPFQVALSHLWAAGIEWLEDLPCVQAAAAVERNIIRKQLETGFNSVPTSSMGRLFDAAAALAGIRQTVTYEAQAAIEFEAHVNPNITASYHFQVQPKSTTAHPNSADSSPRPPQLSPLEIDPTPLLKELVSDVQKGTKTAIIAAKFHNAVADLILQLSHNLREQTGINQVALSGGVFQNVTLLEKAITRLHAANFEILTHQLVSPNDGGLALGQAVISTNSKP